MKMKRKTRYVISTECRKSSARRHLTNKVASFRKEKSVVNFQTWRNICGIRNTVILKESYFYYTHKFSQKIVVKEK